MKQENLRFFYEMSKNEVDFLRDRYHKIFMWVSTILLTIISLLLISKTDEQFLFDFSILYNKIIFSAIIVVVSGLAILWIYRNRKWHRDHIIIQTKIGKVLKAYDKDTYLNENETLFPEKWLKPKRIWLFTSDYNIALLLLTILTLIAIWFYPTM